MLRCDHGAAVCVARKSGKAKAPRSAGRIAKAKRVQRETDRVAKAEAANVRAAFRAAAAAPTDAAVQAAIERGPDVIAHALLPDRTMAEPVGEMMEHGSAAGATIEADLLAGSAGKAAEALVIANPIMPRAAAWAEKRAAELVTEIEAPARQAIRDVVSSAVDRGVHPRTIAKQIRPWVGIHSRNVPPIERYRAALEAKGLPAEKIAARVERKVEHAIRSRCDLIARSETVAAVNQGRAGLYDALAKAGHIEPAQMVRTWFTARDERVCPICDALDGTTADALDGTFPGGVSDPSEAHGGGAFDCRCTILFEEASA